MPYAKKGLDIAASACTYLLVNVEPEAVFEQEKCSWVIDNCKEVIIGYLANQ